MGETKGKVATKAPRPKSEALPPTTTVKLSRFLREYVILSAEWNESIDHVLRRLLGLSNGQKPVQKAPELDKKVIKEAEKAAAMPGVAPTVTVKISRFLREYVLDEAKRSESIDFTFRRMLGLPIEEKA
jgi:negative regulator of replication initiation